MEITDYKHILDCISPSLTDRNTWVKVGMALKYEGVPFEVYDQWSAGDSRPGEYKGTKETLKVWDSFRNLGSGTVTGATLTEIARQQGVDPFPKNSDNQVFFGWDYEVTADEEPKPQKVPERPVFRSSKKDPFQIIDYLESCFKPDDRVNIITSVFTDPDGKRKPYGAGIMSLTAGEICEQLREVADKPDAVDRVIGSYDSEAGVWVRINPITGSLEDGQKAVTDKNVTRFDNALIECDELSLDEQMRIIKAINLPYRALVYSGGKSVHVIVPINAKSLGDYQEKVKWLQEYCIANGLPVDEQNKNPSRMSRLPGIDRGNQKQVLLETNLHPQSFEEFKRDAEAEKEGMELEIESFATYCDNLPELAPEMIEGVLRRGHKMLIAGPPKAGKSFALLSLTVAVAEGQKWMGCQCRSGRVLYLNFEVDPRSFWHRISNVYKALGYPMNHPESIDVMNLRGKTESLDDLAPKLAARLKRTRYDIVVFDPIYKIITGDENNASEMGKFCNLFDRIATAGDCSVVYCHHHSKGSQAQKSAIDRASGSGVFARDPDAILDMTELYLSELDREELKARLCEAVDDKILKSTGQWENLKNNNPELLEDRIAKQELVEKRFDLFPDNSDSYRAEIEKAKEIGSSSAYRLSMTLREFKSPEDKEIIFAYPVHVEDATGYLKNMYLQGDTSPQTMTKKHIEKAQKRADKKRDWYESHSPNGEPVSISELAAAMGVKSAETIKNWIKSQPDLEFGNGWIVKAGETPPPQKRRKKEEK